MIVQIAVVLVLRHQPMVKGKPHLQRRLFDVAGMSSQRRAGFVAISGLVVDTAGFWELRWWRLGAGLRCWKTVGGAEEDGGGLSELLRCFKGAGAGV